MNVLNMRVYLNTGNYYIYEEWVNRPKNHVEYKAKC